MTFCLKILGSGSSVPADGRHHTAHLLTINNTHYLIDCGEGTQLSLMKYRLKQNRINAIFISHLHGDHYLGLTGLVSSMHLLGRQQPLNILAPPVLREIITLQFKYSNTVISFDLRLTELTGNGPHLIHETPTQTVHSFPLEHRVPCWGFIFREKPKSRRINKEKLPEKILIQDIIRLKSGEDLTDHSGSVIYKNEDLTFPPKKSRSYAYCSDTVYDPRIISYINGVDLLYHESTFLKEKEDIAAKTYHTTAEQAAMIAKAANAKKLIIGHYSARYKDISGFQSEAEKTFGETELALEGKTFCVEE